ncbi:hypothetical protein ACN27F_03110 [Solwaraspora sp. WMMB335]|uniref:hypothetical protein n=1 Tax=Solwaraspora sp. WMMB335 TaxID=3404118 RepID=UPI003B936E34
MAQPLAHSWNDVWGPTIKNLIEKNEVLGPKNNLMKNHLKNENMRNLATKLVDTLIANDPAMAAQQVLDEMRKLLPVINQDTKEARPLPATTFPTNTYKQLLELVSAKMLWQNNATWIEPGSQKGGSALKPDYSFQGKQENEAAGDHVVVQNAKDSDALVTQIASNLSNKLTKYKDVLEVFVVIHVTECPAFDTLKNQDSSGWFKLMAAPAVESLKNKGILDNFSYLVIIAGDKPHIFPRDNFNL